MELCAPFTGAVSIGDAIAGLVDRARGKARPTGQKVHAPTKTMRGREGGYWTPFDRRHVSRILQTAQQHDQLYRLQHRTDRDRRKNGSIGHIGMEVLRELLRLIDFRTGRLDPAIETIARRVGRSASAVADALKRLKLHGFIDWIRRYVETGERGRRGPQVQQTSNAYRITLPKALAGKLASPPLPDDDSHRRQIAAADAEAMVTALPLDEQPEAIGITHPELCRLLSSYARGIMERDVDGPNESHPKV